jgi:hypothetical protein
MYMSPKPSTNQGSHVGPSLGQVGLEGGRPAPLWRQLDTTLVGMHAKKWQREHRRCRVSLAKKHAQSSTWWTPDRPLS